MSDEGASVTVSSHLVWVLQLLMIAERTLGGLVRPAKIEEMEEELTRLLKISTAQ